MLELYFDPGCLYCQRVLRHLDRHDIEFEPKEISLWANSPTKQKLIEIGGKGQVPFLVDPQNDVKMYESENILAYLRNYAKGESDT